jgi:hypothetical protein
MSDSADPKLISGERLVFSTSQHWAALIAAAWLPIVFALVSVALGWIQPDATTGILGFYSRTIELVRLTLFLGGCAWIIYYVVAWRTAQYFVTNFRILGQEGLVRRRSTDTLLTSLSDIRTVVPVLGARLGFGNIRIITASGDAGKDVFSGVRDAEQFKRHVLEQKAGSERSVEPLLIPSSDGAEHLVQSQAPSISDGLQAAKLVGRLAALRDSGAITSEEYEAKKVDLLRRI